LSLNNCTAAQIVAKLKKKEISSADAAEFYLGAVRSDNQSEKPLNAVIRIDEDALRKSAAVSDPDSMLAGLPVAVKDNMCIKGRPMQCASAILKGYTAPYTAGAIENLEKNGAVIFGYTNMDEFAMGSSNETGIYGICRNPVNREYIPGGSSGGSASAVAGGLVPAALGSDTGGSIRLPAAVCGITGLKPTYGRVSRYGLTAYGSSLDQIGPLTKSAEDAALLLKAIAGYDMRDATSVKTGVPDFTASLNQSIKKIRIGIPEEYFSSDLNPLIHSEIEKVLHEYKSMGCVCKTISLPSVKYAIPAYYIIACAEASANLARFDGVRYGARNREAKNLQELYYFSRSEGFGTEVQRRILLGTFALSSGYYDAYYKKAQLVRNLVRKDFKTAFNEVDAVIAPILPDPVFKIGDRIDDPVKMMLADIFTTGPNLSGIPAIALPCASDPDGLPVGFQLMGPDFSEPLLLNLAHVYQSEKGLDGWRKR